MNSYDQQRDLETEVYSQKLYDTESVQLANEIENFDDAIAYIVDAKNSLNNAKDRLRDLKRYISVAEYQSLIDALDNDIAELEIAKSFVE